MIIEIEAIHIHIHKYNSLSFILRMYQNKTQQNTLIRSKKYVKKGSPQYLFLNMIRSFSIVFLVMTILYIPVYIGIAQANNLYFISSESNYTWLDLLKIQGTLFAIKKYQVCINYTQPITNITINDNTIHNDTTNNLTNNIKTLVPLEIVNYQNLLPLRLQMCYRNKIVCLPFIDTVQDFHRSCILYYFFTHFIMFLLIVRSEYNNLKLFIQLQYPLNSSQSQLKKIYHVQHDVDWPIYMLKPLLSKKLTNFFDKRFSLYFNQQLFQISNVKIKLNQKFKKYIKVIMKIENIKTQIFKLTEISESNQKQKNKTQIQQHLTLKFQQQGLAQNTQQQGLKQKNQQQDMTQKYQQLTQLQLQKMHYQILLQNDSMKYHIQHIWINLQKYQSCLAVQNLLKYHKGRIIQNSKQAKSSYPRHIIKINRIDFSDIITKNIQKYQSSQRLTKLLLKKTSQNNILHANQHLLRFNKVLKYIKFLSGIVICLVLIISINILIMIIEKSIQITYLSMIIILLLQFLLKQIIIQLSIKQHHLLHSYKCLSIMLKLTLLLLFNMSFLLIVSNQNLGNWQLGRLISNYQFQGVTQLWYLKVGVQLVGVVIVQIIVCNSRVYIQPVKHIILEILMPRLRSLIKLKGLKQKLKTWIKQYKQSYQKPVIDLQICYSHILSIYLMGLLFSYVFPILYPLLLIFSILLHISHKSYIQLYTQKIPFNNTLLNNWSYVYIYGGLLGGIGLISIVQDVYCYVLCYFVCLVLLIIFKLCWFDLDRMIRNRLQMLTQIQNSYQYAENHYGQYHYGQNHLFKSAQQHFINTNQITQSVQSKYQQNTLFKGQIQQKILETKFAQFLSEKKQNITEIHAQYFQIYKNMLKKQKLFLQRSNFKINHNKSNCI